jgi:hypothetical protein
MKHSASTQSGAPVRILERLNGTDSAGSYLPTHAAGEVVVREAERLPSGHQPQARPFLGARFALLRM